MTTIAFKDNMIAFDSRITRGGDILTDSYDKHKEEGGCLFFLSGYPCDFEDLIALYFNKPTVKDHSLLDESDLIVVDSGQVMRLYCTDKGERCVQPVSWDSAWGSGQRYAVGAMDMGASAREAVAVACKRDMFTGGTIQEIHV